MSLQSSVGTETVQGGPTIYLIVANLLQCVCAKIYEYWSAVDKIIAIVIDRLLYGATPCITLLEPVNQRSSRYQLRSSQSNKLVVPPVKLSTYGPCLFAVAGPTTWNSLPEYLRDPELSIDSFRHQLKLSCLLSTEDDTLVAL